MLSSEMDCSPHDLQFLEKFNVAYLTPKEKGIGKAPRPPLVRKIEIKKVAPKTKSKGWFPLEPYQKGFADL
jgi:hypothetical protein